jgi:HMG (high mobility group) box
MAPPFARIYGQFVWREQPTVQLERPGMSPDEVREELLRRWRELGPDGRAPFVARAREQRTRTMIRCQRAPLGASRGAALEDD